MARPKKVTIAPVAAVADDICLAQTKASSGALTLNGAKAATTLDYGRKLDFFSSANIAARVFTVTGTDFDLRAQTDTVTGINNSTVQTAKYFRTLTSITVDASFSANNVTVGTSDDMSTKTIPLDFYSQTPAEICVELNSGTATFSVQETFSDVYDATNTTFEWITPTALSGKSATTVAPLDQFARGVRLVTSAFSTPSIDLIIMQGFRF